MLMSMLYQTIIVSIRLCRYSLGVLHIGVGFGVARFDGMGNVRASECGTSDSTDSRAFSFKIRILLNPGGL